MNFRKKKTMEKEKKDLKKRTCYPMHSAQMMNFMEDCTHLKFDIKFVKDILSDYIEEGFNVDTALENLNIVKWTAEVPESLQKPGRPDIGTNLPDYFLVLKPKKMKKLVNKLASCKGSVLSSQVMLSQECFNFPINVTDIIYDCAYKLLNILLQTVNETKYPTFYDEFMQTPILRTRFWNCVNFRMIFNLSDISDSKIFVSLDSSLENSIRIRDTNLMFSGYNKEYITGGLIAISGYTWNIQSRIFRKNISEKINDTSEANLKFPSLCFIYKKV